MSFEPRIIAFLCTWCSYTGADTAGIARLKSPANVRAIRVPCSGRVSPEIIMKTFDQGADGVLVLGCHIGECHYQDGNHRTAKRIPVLKELLSVAGLEPERLRLDWVSASEGERFARITTEFTHRVRELGPAQWKLKPVGERTVYHELETKPEIIPCVPGDTTARIEDIRKNARQLLESGWASLVIGYELGPRGQTRPAFIHSVNEVDKLVWNADCSANLTTYLPHLFNQESGVTTGEKRIALVVKPCDSRAVNVMLPENRFKRESIHLLGVSCEGMRTREGNLQTRCIACGGEAPLACDTLIGEKVPHANTPSTTFETVALTEMDSMSPTQRLDYWLSQFDRCLRCYACRQVCPMCKCPECLYERDEATFAGPAVRLDEKRAFHLGRAWHLAGRCIGCNECERVCPVNIPIGLLNHQIAGVIRQEFKFSAGDQACPSPIVTVLPEGYRES